MAEDWLSARAVSVIALGLAGGFGLARAHLAALAANIRLYLTPQATRRALGLHAVRLAALAASFTFAAAFGAPALIATLLGFTLGRTSTLGRTVAAGGTATAGPDR